MKCLVKKMQQGETIRIKLNDEMLMLLMRGGQVNYVIAGVQIRIEQEKDLVVIDKQDFRDLKRYHHEPYVLEAIFKRIDK